MALIFLTIIFIELFIILWRPFGLYVPLGVIIAVLLVSKLRVICPILVKPWKFSHLWLIIIILALTARLLWIFLINTTPVSDFNLMYSYAQKVHQGDFSGFHNYEYFARFMHDTVTVLYFSFFYYLSPSPLILIKIGNALWSTLAVYFMYKTGKQIYGEKLGLAAAFLLAIFPPAIMYTSQTMSENMAFTFFIISGYFFTSLIVQQPQDRWQTFRLLTLCGCSLAMANMFRMIGIVFLAAYLVYFLFNCNFKKAFGYFFTILVTFSLYIYIVSSVLLLSGITETHLWHSKEPFWTSVLKGTNFQTIGFWNEEDAKIPDIYNHDPKKITQACKDIIKERLSSAPPAKLAIFYLLKFSAEWTNPDMSAYYWTVPNAVDTASSRYAIKYQSEILKVTAIIYFTLIYLSILSLIALFKDNKQFYKQSFFVILFVGYVLFLLITEAQSRYAFSVSWVLIVMAVGGIKSLTVSSFLTDSTFPHRIPEKI